MQKHERQDSPKQQSQSVSGIGSKQYYCDHRFQSVFSTYSLAHISNASHVYIPKDLLVVGLMLVPLITYLSLFE